MVAKLTTLESPGEENTDTTSSVDFLHLGMAWLLRFLTLHAYVQKFLSKKEKEL